MRRLQTLGACKSNGVIAVWGTALCPKSARENLLFQLHQLVLPQLMVRLAAIVWNCVGGMRKGAAEVIEMIQGS